MNFSGPDEESATLPAGLGEYQLTLSNNQTRHFLAKSHPASSSSNGEKLEVVIVLHPSTKLFQNYDPYAAAYNYEAIIGEEITKAAVSSFSLARKNLIFIFPVAREVGDGWYCWGAGNDNDLCTAPVDGIDSEFIIEIIKWIHLKFGGKFWPPSSSMSRVFLFGYSGGARMGWRLACDSRFENILDGVAIASGLLPEHMKAEQRNGIDSCKISSLPSRIVVLHGELDPLTRIEYADDSVQWISQSADCQVMVENQIGIDELFNYTECTKNHHLALAYYRKIGGPHISPDAVQMQTIFKHWSHNRKDVNVSDVENLENINTSTTENETYNRIDYMNEVVLGYIFSICLIALVVHIRRYR